MTSDNQAARCRITFLGTGTSTGVPVIGCKCEVCTSLDPRNQRMRSSILIETDECHLLIDAGPDLRHQALRHDLSRVDAVLYTHGHMDHVVGFDELRAFCWHRQRPLPLYANQGCMDILTTMFGWAFSVGNTDKGYVKPDPHVFREPFAIRDVTITPIPVLHGNVETNGFLFRFSNSKTMAYIPDVKSIPNSSLDLLHGCDFLAIDALHHRAHHNHMNVEEAIATIGMIQPQQAYLTHLSHEIEHQTVNRSLPAGIRLAYDTLCLTL